MNLARHAPEELHVGGQSRLPDQCADVVRWGQGPLDFELETTDQRVLHIARRVFAPWTQSRARRIGARWRVSAAESGFIVESETAGDELEKMRFAETAESAVTMVEFSSVERIVFCEESILCLHSALLSRGGRGVVIAGPAFAGKSTLACALWRSGWSLLSDDATLFIDGLAFPSPRRVSLRFESESLVGADLWQRVKSSHSFAQTGKGYLFHPSEVTPGERVAATSVAAVVFLARRGAAGSSPPGQPLTPVQMAMAARPYTNLSHTLSFSQSLGRLSTLAETVPGYDLARAPLSEMVAAIDQLTGLA